ncbi:phosphate ABC transporter substrate-binding protein PstS [Micromonospora sp. NPDC000089]|uniref:phosphate ABC transporter substrate-binding protein PstS n=1 Tax=unclassified Micromonospora TaxID=2617518 RepID=UPI0036AE7DA2
MARRETRRPPITRIRRLCAATLTAVLTAAVALLGAPAAHASYVKIVGVGSTWSEIAIREWKSNIRKNGISVEYTGTGSSDGRNQFRNGTVDFAVSEIPYGLRDAGSGTSDPAPARGFAYMPIVAGGTAFMYHIRIGGKLVTNLRLSGDVLTKIFTRKITKWNDPAIKADNPGLTLPARTIVPVVRSDGSGTTAQFTLWMSAKYPDLWNDWCRQNKRATPCGVTSYYPYPTDGSVVAQAGSLGVSGYVAQSLGEGAITYVEYAYAKKSGFPVAKVRNRSNYYVEPTANSVAVGLGGAKVNPTDLTQDLRGVYDNGDRRAYPLSSYSYMILPTKLESGFTTDKGETLGRFAYYFLCEGQRSVGGLGYSPLPRNLVQEGLKQVARIPGVKQENIVIAKCNNPTFSPDGKNLLAKTAPYPPACDAYGALQCATGTAGAPQNTPTRGGGNNGGGNNTGGGTTGGAGTGGTRGGAAGTPGTPGRPAGTAGAGTGAAGPNGVPAGGAPPQVDPDTGEVVNGGTSGGTAQYVDGVPVALAADGGWGLDRTLMILSGLLLVLVIIAPPLLARSLGGRDQGGPR